MSNTAKSVRSGKGEFRVAPSDIHALCATLFASDMHAARVLSLANGVVGVIHAAALSIHAVGHALAQAQGLVSKHAIKQVDRLLSNGRFDVWAHFAQWVPYIIGDRSEIVVALDWTDFEADDHTTIAAYLITSHGRATPLLWKTFYKSTLEGRRNDYEDELVARLREIVPPAVHITVLADRGFGDQVLYKHLVDAHMDFVIRFRGAIHVTDAQGETRPASEWVPSNGRICALPGARVTAKRSEVGVVVCVKKAGMKEPWCLASSLANLTGAEIVKLYSRRFTIEETFRDEKDLRFGMGLRATHIGDPARRDRMLFLGAIAHALMTMLGAASEETGLDRLIKANTVKRRTHSLFRQGCYWYRAIPNMPEDRLRMLMNAFGRIVAQHRAVTDAFGVV